MAEDDENGGWPIRRIQAGVPLREDAWNDDHVQQARPPQRDVPVHEERYHRDDREDRRRHDDRRGGDGGRHDDRRGGAGRRYDDRRGGDRRLERNDFAGRRQNDDMRDARRGDNHEEGDDRRFYNDRRGERRGGNHEERGGPRQYDDRQGDRRRNNQDDIEDHGQYDDRREWRRGDREDREDRRDRGRFEDERDINQDREYFGNERGAIDDDNDQYARGGRVRRGGGRGDRRDRRDMGRINDERNNNQDREYIENRRGGIDGDDDRYARGGGDRRGEGRGERGDRRQGMRGDRGGRGRGADRGGARPLNLSMDFLRQEQRREPSEIILTLSNPNTKLREALVKCASKPDMMKLMLNVLAKAFTCNSMPTQLNRLIIIIKELHFLDTAMTFFLDMRGETRVREQESFKQPIKDIITIMEELAIKCPRDVTQFLGIHAVVQMTIDYLRENALDVIDDDILRSFKELTDLKDDKLKNSARRLGGDERDKQRREDAEIPPDDFRTIPIFPQSADIESNDDRYLRSNKVKGHYHDLDHYLDVQFRLLREDFVAPLRDGVNSYIQAMEERGKKKRKIQDVRIYNNVRIIAPDCGENGLCHMLQFDVSSLGQVNWRSTKRLIYGSLICLSPDNFKTFYFATVMNREPKDLQNGILNVRFEHDYQTVKELFGQIFTMAETTAYFESYRHVLTGLQHTRQGDLPFERYIIKCESDVKAPAYLRRRPDTVFDLRPLVDDDIVLKDDIRLGENIGQVEVVNADYRFSAQSAPAEKVRVLDRKTWPPTDLLHLDPSQYKAIHTALTKEFVITQGPPGTGKTYIGLKIVKALLHNKEVWSKHPDTGERDRRPMLIVCYTNHALDQFLEGIIQFYKGDILRVGSRSSSEVLKSYNLSNFRQRFRHAQKIPIAVFQGRREAKREMDNVTTEISRVTAKIKVATTCILREDFLQPFIGQTHYLLLTQQFDMLLQVYPEARNFIGKNHSIIVEWLELGNIAPIVQIEGNVAPVVNIQDVADEEEQDEELIDVEDEVDVIQAHRRLEGDDGEEDEFEFDELIDELIGDLSKQEENQIRLQLAVSEQLKAVALNVEQLSNKPKNMQEGEWETQKKERKNMKKKIQKQLASADRMTSDEAKTVNDMWRMALKDKWRLYRFWIQKYCNYLIDMIEEKEKEFEEAARRYKEALMQEDKEIMRNSTIIGMTTTGAARYQAVLQEIRPRIIVVEEAAEVLEAHIVTTLSRGCEHLILIGDHKQLKPNPTVYKLATDYNLDVSLFERMITNGIQCDCLELQHRMRPEIAMVMHHIYDNLRDHEDVKQYENIKGVSKNIFFVDHTFAESHNEDLRSHSNRHEAEYTVALCRYLLLQGYSRKQITILTLYSGQLFCLRNIMPKEEFEGVRVTVVDNYQGEENDIILLSLVRSNQDGHIGFLKIENRICVALSRAKKGLYVIGNFELLRDKSRLWNEIVIDMKTKGQLGEELILFCQNHPDENGIKAKKPSDFLKAPEGGCDRKCNYRLNCGHVCEAFCHVIDQEHKEYICRKRCGKNICENRHRCEKLCSQKCGPCTKKVAKPLPRCGHIQQVPCSTDPREFECKEECQDILVCGHKCQAKCGMAHTQRCNFTVEKTWPCGHKGKIKCHMKDVALCQESCDSVLDCEHRCFGTCGSCFQGRLHKPCRNDCIRILVCGHECTDKCNQCPPCTRKCENRCQHSRCNRRCGELCVPCKEQCTWRCEHYRCGKLCSEPCDRPRCDQPCRKRLPCGHQCIGLCGEPCPPDCRECDKEKVTEVLFGNEDEPDAKFVLLEDCKNKCIIESKAMDQYMDLVDERREILLKNCPKCKTPIRKSNRYRQIINKTLLEIETVKKKVLINKDRIVKLETDITEQLQEADNSVLKRRFHEMVEPKSENALTALVNQLTLLKHLRKTEKDWSDFRGGLEFANEKLEILNFIKLFSDWIMEERSVMTAQETTDAELEISRLRAHLKLLLHQQRAKELGKTMDSSLRAKVREAEKLIKGKGKYKEQVRIVVEQCIHELEKTFPLSGLAISEEERVMIVKAMELPAGHWFTCPQGHVYAIADCGGAMVESKCPDCGSTIGGTAHRLRGDNQFFGQMDGAQHPAWSEQANLVNYGFHAQF